MEMNIRFSIIQQSIGYRRSQKTMGPYIIPAITLAPFGTVMTKH